MFSSISEILDELRAGRMVVLTDDESRENEGDLVLPAQFVTPEALNFMLREARGYLCLSMTEADCQRLGLEPQASVNTSARATPFTVSIDGHPRHGFTTGVSAQERSRTIQMAIDPRSSADDFVRPGHINPLRSRDGGVLVRVGQTEGSVDLCRLAGLYPAALIIEITREDGEMARGKDLQAFCAAHGLRICSVAQIIEHRLARERIVRRLDPVGGTSIATPEGEFTLFAFESTVDPMPHVVLSAGGVGMPDDGGVVAPRSEPTLVRVHRRDLLGDVFGERRGGEASGGETLRASMRMIAEAGAGAVVYLRPQGAGDDLRDRLMTVRRSGSPLQAAPPAGQGEEAVESRTWREVGTGSQILRDLGLSRLRLITGHDTGHPALEAFGIEIVERVRPE